MNKLHKLSFAFIVCFVLTHTLPGQHFRRPRILRTIPINLTKLTGDLKPKTKPSVPDSTSQTRLLIKWIRNSH